MGLAGCHNLVKSRLVCGWPHLKSGGVETRQSFGLFLLISMKNSLQKTVRLNQSILLINTALFHTMEQKLWNLGLGINIACKFYLVQHYTEACNQVSSAFQKRDCFCSSGHYQCMSLLPRMPPQIPFSMTHASILEVCFNAKLQS